MIMMILMMTVMMIDDCNNDCDNDNYDDDLDDNDSHHLCFGYPLLLTPSIYPLSFV
jgi:hypothetical protein